MNKALWLKLTVIFLPLIILIQILSGFLSDELKSLFLPIHLVGAALIVALGIVHAVLNWGWISKQFFHKRQTK